MKIPSLNPYYRAAVVMSVAAVILVVFAVMTPEKGLTSAALVIAGVSCLFTGIVLAALSGPEPLDTRFVSLLPVQGQITTTRICAEFGIAENALFLPPHKDRGGRIMQFNPVTPFDGEIDTIRGGSLTIPPAPAGLLAEPAAGPLLDDLRSRHGLVVPADPAAISDLFREVGVDLLETADRVTTETGGATITVRMSGYRLIEGCRAVQKESPRCCLVSPCPVASLLACLAVEATGRAVRLEHCSPDTKDGSVTLAFSILEPAQSP